MLKNNNWIKSDFENRLEMIKKIYIDIISSKHWKDLLFKWWTSLVLFYWLERFSEDLDFNLIDTKRIKKVVDWIYQDLKSKWYQLSEIYRDWTNVVHIDLFYKIWNNDYICQLEFFKNNYWVIQKYTMIKIQWIHDKVYANLLDLWENFAHKCCAYLERWNRKIERSWKPKWRDLFDISFYLSKDTKVDMNIVTIRTKIKTQEELFLEILKTLFIKHKKYHNELLEEINNFWYSTTYLTFDDFLHSFVRLVNNKILNWRFSFNQNYLKDLKEDWFSKISNFSSIQLDEKSWFYTIFIKDTSWNKKNIYTSKKLEFIEDYVEKNFQTLTLS